MKIIFPFKSSGLETNPVSELSPSTRQRFARNHPGSKFVVNSPEARVIYAICETQADADAALNALVNLKVNTLPVS